MHRTAQGLSFHTFWDLLHLLPVTERFIWEFNKVMEVNIGDIHFMAPYKESI